MNDLEQRVADGFSQINSKIRNIGRILFGSATITTFDNGGTNLVHKANLQKYVVIAVPVVPTGAYITGCFDTKDVAYLLLFDAFGNLKPNTTMDIYYVIIGTDN